MGISARVRMRDVAALAGVSTATVSAVLNEGSTRIRASKATHEKILAAARKLDYHLNEHARALREGKSNIIGVVAADITQPFSGEMLRVVENEMHRWNYNFLVSDARSNKKGNRFYLELGRTKKVDALLFLGASAEIEDRDISRLIENEIPVVLTERELMSENVPCVLVDNVRGGFVATEHLISQGCRSVAYIRGPRKNIICSQRQDGYRQALQKHGLAYSDKLVLEGGITPERGYGAMVEILKRMDLPAAVFAFNDTVAFGALRAIRSKGLSVPNDIAVVGYDDIPMAAYVEPPLTTISQPVQAMCRKAVQMLLGILTGQLRRDYFQRVLLEPKLIVHESCGYQRNQGEVYA